MTNRTTQLVFVIDASGSMSALRDETIDGFNKLITEQRKLENDDAFVTLVTFNNTHTVVHDCVPIADVPELTSDVYHTSGGTALLDAMGFAIDSIRNNPDAVGRVLFAVMTDGHENMSFEYKGQRIPELVKQCIEDHEWEFVYLGADIDAFDTSRNIGVLKANIAPRMMRGQAGDMHKSFGTLHSVASKYRTNISYDLGETVVKSAGAVWDEGTKAIADSKEPPTND